MASHRRRRRRNRNTRAQPQDEVPPPVVADANERGRLPRIIMPKTFDEGPLMINCTIRGTAFNDCLCDTGASISIMSLSIARRLRLQRFRTQFGRMTFADQETTRQFILLEDVPVMVADAIVLTDFAVLSTGDGQNDGIIFGRPFLQSTNAVLNMSTGVVLLTFDSHQHLMHERNEARVNPPRRTSGSSEHCVNTVSHVWDPWPSQPQTPVPGRRESITPTFLEKQEDPGCLTISCSINRVTFPRCICDTGASINVMPLSVAKRLGLKNFEHGNHRIRLADQSIAENCAVLKDVLVVVCGVTILTDFTIISMKEEPEYVLLLGRPFLSTTDAQMNMLTGTVTLNLGLPNKKMFTRNGSVLNLPAEPLYSPTEGPGWFSENEEESQSWIPEIERKLVPLHNQHR